MLRNEYSGITAIGTGFIVQKGDTIEIGDMKIRLRIDDIKYVYRVSQKNARLHLEANNS